MGRVDDRLVELGITLPGGRSTGCVLCPCSAVGRSRVDVRSTPVCWGELPGRGKVGAEVSPDNAREYARRAALNALAAVKAEIGDLDDVKRIVKVVGFVASAPDFTGQPAVINGASEVLREIFGERGVHARSAVGVAVLPLDAPVEVELVVELAQS